MAALDGRLLLSSIRWLHTPSNTPPLTSSCTLTRCLSVALQSSNADIAQLAMQQFHLHQHAANKCTYEIARNEHWVRTTKYAQAADGDQLARRVSLVVQAAECKALERADLMGAASDSAALAFVHERRVGVADIARSINQCGLITSAA